MLFVSLSLCSYVYEGQYASQYRALTEPGAGQKALDAVRKEFEVPRDRLQRLIADFVNEVRALGGDSLCWHQQFSFPRLRCAQS